MAILLTVAALLASVAAAQYVPSNVQTTQYGISFDASTTRGDTDYPTIRGEIIYAQRDMLRLRLFPTGAAEQPYLVPDEIYPQSKKPAAEYTAAADKLYTAEIVAGGPLLEVRSAGRTVAAFDFSRLDLDVQRCNMSFSYPRESHISGYGERNFKYFLSNEGGPVTLSSWNTDNLTPWKDPMYAVNPVVFVSNPITSTFSVVMQMNSHAQQATIDPTDARIEFFAVGGTVDLHVFVGATALDVMASYQKYIGPAEVPPYWSLGTHQCKYGYSTLQDLKDVVEGYAAADMPLQTLWNDIDYMDTFHIFTVDEKRYAGLKQFVDDLQAGGRRYVQIVDPGVAVNELNYSVYQRGEERDVFMKRDGETLVGVVWPGWTTFPDFSHPNVSQWWQDEIELYYKNTVKLDGMWTDMNEIASFCGGSCPVKPGTPWTWSWRNMDWDAFEIDICQKNGCAAHNTSLNYPEQRRSITPLPHGHKLSYKTLDMEADTHLGKYYSTKTFYGNLENIATHKALLGLNPAMRPFIVTRSTFTGAGRVTFKWAGDNTATWGDESGGLRASVQGLHAANLAGVFMSGSDIPGFTGPNTTEELADRWYQLGAYYPFMRNHRDLDGSPQEPYRFSERCQDAIREAIARRYRLMPHLFTSLMAGRLHGIPTIMHPSVVFYDQPEQYEETYAMMVGTSLLVVPAVDEGSDDAVVRVPAGTWFDLADTAEAPVRSFHADGSASTLKVPRYSAIPAFQRAGTMIPMHNEAKLLVQDTQATGHALVFAMPSSMSGVASGELIVDTDGSAPLPDEVATNYAGVFAFTAQGGVSKGSISVRTPAATSANPAIAPVQQETFVLLFPSSSPYAEHGFDISNISVTIDGALCSGSEEAGAVACVATSPVPNKIIITFPAGTNANNGFTFDTIRWVANAEPHSGDKDKKGKDKDTWKTLFIVITAVLSVALVVTVATVALLKYRKNRKTNAYEDVTEPVLPAGEDAGYGGVNTNNRAVSNLSNRL